MVDVWYGDEFFGVMSYDEFLDLFESDVMYSCQWCEGYGP